MTRPVWPPRGDADYMAEARAKLTGTQFDALNRVRLLVFDVDGVLTRGDIVYGPEGEALKSFDSRDGLGLVLARAAGLRLAVLTGRDSPIAERRARDLRFDVVKLGRFDKQRALREILDETGVEATASLYMGDDLIDIPALDLAGAPVTVPEAERDVRERCILVTQAGGGRGAVREAIELVLKARGLFGAALQRVAERAWAAGPED